MGGLELLEARSYELQMLNVIQFASRVNRSRSSLCSVFGVTASRLPRSGQKQPDVQKGNGECTETLEEYIDRVKQK